MSRSVRLIADADFDAAMAMRSFAFGHPLSDEHREFLRSNAAHILGSFEDGELKSVATMWPFTAYVGGARKPLGGLASVATEPTARRRGHVADLLRAWFTRLCESGCGLSADSPFDPRFYARYGYQSVPHGYLLRPPMDALGPAEAVDAQRLDPGDYAYSSPAGRRRLLAYLAGFAGQVATVQVMVPPGEPLAAMYGDRNMRRTTGLQVRVVDLPLALEGLKAPAEDGFDLALHDPDCPWQDGVFRVTVGPDGCEAKRLDGAVDADVRMGPLGLAAALFHAQDPGSLLATGAAEGDERPLRALAGLLARHPVYMPRADHF